MGTRWLEFRCYTECNSHPTPIHLYYFHSSLSLKFFSTQPYSSNKYSQVYMSTLTHVTNVTCTVNNKKYFNPEYQGKIPRMFNIFQKYSIIENVQNILNILGPNILDWNIFYYSQCMICVIINKCGLNGIYWTYISLDLCRSFGENEGKKR